MKIKCASCLSVLVLDENKYHKENLLIQCPKCKSRFKVSLPTKHQPVLAKTVQDPTLSKDGDQIPSYPHEEKTKKQKDKTISDSSTQWLSWLFFFLFIACILYALFDLFIK
jgi:phage FluMu protein Com